MRIIILFLLIILKLNVFAQKTVNLVRYAPKNPYSKKIRSTILETEYYNADNNLVKKIIWGDALKGKKRVPVKGIYYNEKQQITEEKNFWDTDTTRFSGIIYMYDNGRIVKDSSYKNGQPDYWIAGCRNYIYDNNGLLKEIKWKGRVKDDRLGLVDFILTYGYDSENRLIRKDSGYRYEYTYDEVNGNKRITELRYERRKKPVYKREMVYNNKGLVIQLVYKDLSPGSSTGSSGSFIYEYEYDADGNWKSQTACPEETPAAYEGFSKSRLCTVIRKEIAEPQ